MERPNVDDWDRRSLVTLLAGLLAISGLGGCAILPGQQEKYDCPPGSIVDVHVHVFNASDIPATESVKRVYSEKYTDPVCYTWPRDLNDILILLVGILSATAPTAKTELAYLKGKSRATWPTTASARRRHEVRILSKELSNLYHSGGYAVRETGLLQDLAAGTGSDFFAVTSSSDRPMQKDFESFAEEVLNSIGALFNAIRWGFLMLRPRHEILHNYAQLYAQSGCVKLFTPSLLDLDQWIGGNSQSSLESQIDLMDYLQKRTDRFNLPNMHCFVPFDPWRYVETEGRCFDMIEKAVLEKGFIGVEVYPPMDFSPSGVYPDDTNGLCFPKAAEKHGGDFPARIDTALERLYRFCNDNDVPIMAHATNRQGAGAAFGKRAHPKFWRKVLEDYGNLRSNLAHFGFFEEKDRNKNWEKEVVDLVRSFNQTRPRVLADLGDFSHMLQASPTRKRVLAEFLELKKQHGGLEKFLMFGTDWTMLARNVGYQNYVPRMAAFLKEANFDDAARQSIFHENEIAFFGLDRPGTIRRRLNKYCGPTKCEWLGQVRLR